MHTGSMQLAEPCDDVRIAAGLLGMQGATEMTTRQLRTSFAAASRAQLPPLGLPTAALEGCRAALDVALCVSPCRAALTLQGMLPVRLALS